MDLSTSGNSLSEDEDDDCVITLVKPGASITTKPAGLRENNSLDLLGVKKERAENGNLYLFLDVKEEDAQEQPDSEEEFAQEQRDSEEEDVQETALVDSEEEEEEEEDGKKIFGDLLLDQILPAAAAAEEGGGPQKAVDLTPFLSYLSTCINESRTTEALSSVIAAEDDEFLGGSGVEVVEILFPDSAAAAASCAPTTTEPEDFVGNGVEAVEILPDSSVSCVPMEPDVSGEKADGICVTQDPNSSGALGAAAAADLNSVSAALAGTANPVGSLEEFDDGGALAMELLYPVSSSGAAASAAPVEAGDEEMGIEEDECCDGCSQGNGFRGFEANGVEVDRFEPQLQEGSGAAAVDRCGAQKQQGSGAAVDRCGAQKQECSGAAAFQEQQECVETKGKEADGQETQEQEEEEEEEGLAQTPLTSSDEEDGEVCRECSPSEVPEEEEEEEEEEIHATAIDKIISNTADLRFAQEEEAMEPISPPPTLATGNDDTGAMGKTNQSSKAGGTRSLLGPQCMFSWYGLDIMKLPSGGFALPKPFESSESRKQPSQHHDYSPCSSQSYDNDGDDALGSSKGSESNNPSKRRGLNAKGVAMVPASSSAPCSNSIGEEEAEEGEGEADDDDGYEKCEGSPLGVVPTPLQIHHLKGAPRKCRALRRVVSPFEYEESWKGLMPANGEEVREKERQKVIQALYTFEELRAHLRRAEEERVAKGRAEGIACRERPDLKACTEMRLRGLQVNTNEYIGNVPGVCVGDRFWYRIEMVVIGLHKQLEAGIAFISRMKSCSGIPVATSIVMKHSGNPYRDDRDDGEFITYTGQGGLSTRNSTARNIADQVLTRGNEALKNSYESHLPIRVIRGAKDARSPTGDAYTYIGLYHILRMRYEPGKDGNMVYMFDLQRQGGQHPLPICAPKPIPQIANKAGPSKSLSLKRKWDKSLESGDAITPCSSKEQWGIPVDISNVKQALYVRGSW